MKKPHWQIAMACVVCLGCAAAANAAPKAHLPLVIYSAGNDSSYVPSGYMGSTNAISMDENSSAHPHSGKVCMKVQFKASSGWGGVVWQDPANDWGDKPGGWNISGAHSLSFWARGDKGGEVVSFSYGLLGAKAKFHDTATGKLNNVALGTAWKHYALSLAGKNLSDIKTGFCWIVAAKGKPVAFYLDDIRYQ